MSVSDRALGPVHLSILFYVHSSSFELEYQVAECPLSVGALLWPDVSQWLGCSTLAKHRIQEDWTPAKTAQHLPTSLARLFSEKTLCHLNVNSCLISAILAVLATAPEEFDISECTITVEAAGAHTGERSFCPTAPECPC